MTLEFLIRNTNGGGLGLGIKVLCSGSFDGTNGPSRVDDTEKLLSLAGAEVTLAAPLACADESNCESPRVNAVGFPWSTEIVSPTVDVISTSGAGWEIDCNTIFGLIEETCTGRFRFVVKNSGTEVLVAFSESEMEANGEQLTCTGGGGKTGLINSDAPGKLTLNNGESLAAS
jgi:hypothetical protein